MDFSIEILLGISMILNAYLSRLYVRSRSADNESIHKLAKDNSNNIHQLIEMTMIEAKERHTYQRLAETKFTRDVQERLQQPTPDASWPAEEYFEEDEGLSAGNRRNTTYPTSTEAENMPSG